VSPLVPFAIVGLAFVVGVGLLALRLHASMGRTPRTRYLAATALAWGATLERLGPLGFETLTLDRGAGTTRVTLAQSPCAHQTRRSTRVEHRVAGRDPAWPELHLVTTGNPEPHIWTPVLPQVLDVTLPGLPGQIRAAAPAGELARPLVEHDALTGFVGDLLALAGLAPWELAIQGRELRLALEGFVVQEPHLARLVALVEALAAGLGDQASEAGGWADGARGRTTIT